MTSFVEVPCGKGGRCHPTLGDDEFFFEPRATVAVHMRSITIGVATSGDDSTGGMGWSAGGLAGIAPPEWRARADVSPATACRHRRNHLYREWLDTPDQIDHIVFDPQQVALSFDFTHDGHGPVHYELTRR